MQPGERRGSAQPQAKGPGCPRSCSAALVINAALGRGSGSRSPHHRVDLWGSFFPASAIPWCVKRLCCPLSGPSVHQHRLVSVHTDAGGSRCLQVQGWIRAAQSLCAASLLLSCSSRSLKWIPCSQSLGFQRKLVCGHFCPLLSVESARPADNGPA